MWVKALLISLLLSTVALAQGSVPIARDTSRASKNLLKESKMLQTQIDALRQYIDSNFVQWGIDTIASLDSATVTISVEYESGTSYAAEAIAEINLANGLYCSTHTDSTFIVHNQNNTTVIFRWLAAGIRKKE